MRLYSDDTPRSRMVGQPRIAGDDRPRSKVTEQPSIGHDDRPRSRMIEQPIITHDDTETDLNDFVNEQEKPTRFNSGLVWFGI